MPPVNFFQANNMAKQTKTSKIDIPRRGCSFVDCCDLFQGLHLLYCEFVNSRPPFSWGDNNRTLVTAESILDHLDACDIDHPKQLKELRKRVEGLIEGNQTYVDLEN